jgi:hypothetical protein
VASVWKSAWCLGFLGRRLWAFGRDSAGGEETLEVCWYDERGEDRDIGSLHRDSCGSVREGRIESGRYGERRDRQNRVSRVFSLVYLGYLWVFFRLLFGTMA